MKTIIHGGTIVNEGKAFVGSIVIDGEKIVATEEHGLTRESLCSSDAAYDATGCFVLPGIIDSHVHFREPGLTERPTSTVSRVQLRQEV